MFTPNFRTAVFLMFCCIFADVGAQETRTPVSVQVTAPRLITIATEKRYNGHLVPEATVKVFANIPGKIVDVHAKPGQKVTKGEVLAESNAREANIAALRTESALIQAQSHLTSTLATSQPRIESQLAIAQEALIALQAKREDTRSLAEMRSRNELTQAEAAYKAAQATFTRSKINAQQAVQRTKAERDKTQLDFDRTKALHQKQHISDSDFESVETRLKVAETRHQESLALLNQFQDGTAQLAVQKVKAALEVARKIVESQGWEREIAAAEAKVTQAEATLRTAQKLVDAKAWEREIAIAESAVKQAEEQVKLARQHVDNAVITAPIYGIIASRQVVVGNYAKPPESLGAPIFTVVATDTLTAEWRLPIEELNGVKKGDFVRVSIPNAIQNIPGTIDFISPTVNNQDNTVLIQANVSKPHQTRLTSLLKPGAAITVAIKTGERKNVQLLPFRAVLYIQKGTAQIFTVDGNTAKRKQISVGAIYGGEIEVTSQLTLKTKVIVDNQHLLQDGASVTIARD